MKHKKPIFFAILLALIAYPAYHLWYEQAGGKPGEEARFFASQHARESDPEERCADASLTAGFYGRAGMRSKYDEWIEKLRVDCPGQYPILPYRPDSDSR
jgi:hypothetical protein